ncbi:unnamed protein product [Sphagnum balticum]
MWLDASIDTKQALAQLTAVDELAYHAVGRAVNSNKYDGIDCVQPVDTSTIDDTKPQRLPSKHKLLSMSSPAKQADVNAFFAKKIKK